MSHLDYTHLQVLLSEIRWFDPENTKKKSPVVGAGDPLGGPSGGPSGGASGG